ncbi:putative adipose-regulatory protein-domain-containing protein [Cladochytrium replicatum]|nr:putative adipose-regulatory protein-domain-containing protein [Cladochytrium replicatum]
MDTRKAISIALKAARQIALTLLWRPYLRLLRSQSVQRATIHVVVFLLVFSTTIGLAFGIYSTFYQMYIPKVHHSLRAYLTFDSECTGRKNVIAESTSSAVFSRTCYPSAHVDLLERVSPPLNDRLLQVDHHYKLGVEMTVPDSSHNFELGNFMIHLTVHSKSNVTVVDSHRPAMLKYKTPLLRAITTLWKALSLVLEISSESQKVFIEMADDFTDHEDDPAHRATIEISEPRLQVYETRLVALAQFQGLRYFMYHWWFTTGSLFISFILFWEGVLMYFGWKLFLRVFAVRKPREKEEKEEVAGGVVEGAEAKDDDEDVNSLDEKLSLGPSDNDDADADAYGAGYTFREDGGGFVDELEDEEIREQRRRRRADYEKKLGYNLDDLGPASASVDGGFEAQSPFLRPASVPYESTASPMSPAPYPGYIPPMANNRYNYDSRPSVPSSLNPYSRVEDPYVQSPSYTSPPQFEDFEGPSASADPDEAFSNELSDYVRNLQSMQSRLEAIQQKVRTVSQVKKSSSSRTQSADATWTVEEELARRAQRRAMQAQQRAAAASSAAALEQPASTTLTTSEPQSSSEHQQVVPEGTSQSSKTEAKLPEE